MTTPSNPSVTADQQLLYSTSVDAAQVDQLGHMNVRFYGVHALAGARVLAERLGLPDSSENTPSNVGGPLRGRPETAFTDMYTRHYFEQLEGAPLEVWGGILKVDETQLQCYFELRNPDRDDLGATFVFTMQYRDASTHESLPLTDDIRDAAENLIIDWPEHGKPRSIDLDASLAEKSLEEVRGLKIEEREIRTIEAKHCDADGLYSINSFQDLVWGSYGISEDNDWLRDLENGDKMGWATMESRCTLIELPRVGARIQSFRATVNITRKAMHDLFWVYDIENGKLLCLASFVEVAFNINTRRAIEIPDFEQEKLNKFFHPELA